MDLLQQHPQAAALLRQEYRAKFPEKKRAEIDALVEEEIKARLEAPETPVDRMQEEAS